MALLTQLGHLNLSCACDTISDASFTLLSALTRLTLLSTADCCFSVSGTAFYMVGSIEEAMEKAQKLAAEAA